jgi:hypothetical protein
MDRANLDERIKMNQKAFLVGTHRYSYRAGKPSEIVGVVFVTRQKQEAHACYQVRFEDGAEDFVPLSEARHFEIISEDDVRVGRIPEVIH